jgi:cAMP-binding proteins - catabolite gene activator and regulatory subunit of cAMP-dependent protein kinases
MKMEKDVLWLRKRDDFKYFTDEEFNQIVKHAHHRFYKKNQVLFDMGDERERMYILESGLVSEERTDESGNFSYFNLIKSEQLFPRIGIFFDDEYHYSVTAYTDIEVWCFPAKIYEDILLDNSQQMLHWIRKQSELTKLETIKIQHGISTNALNKVAVTLAILFDELSEQSVDREWIIPYPITLCVIAKISGLTRETTGVVMKQLEGQSRIHYEHKQLTFLDIEYFEEILEN